MMLFFKSNWPIGGKFAVMKAAFLAVLLCPLASAQSDTNAIEILKGQAIQGGLILIKTASS